MAKLKNIIKQLSASDYQAIHDSLMHSNAEKSAHLLKFIREQQMSDAKVMEELDVNTNAYYTLRSRLNQKIEEYLLAQMESPRTDLLKKVANINDVVFTKKLTAAKPSRSGHGFGRLAVETAARERRYGRQAAKKRKR